MDRISSSSKNYGKSLTSPNSQSQIKISKNSMYKMKSPNYKTPLKAQQVTNFNNANNSPTNINMNTFYQKFTPTSITKQQQFLNKNDKKRKSSFSSHYENDGGSNKKMKNDQCITPRNENIISPKFLKNKNVLKSNNNNTNNKFINLSNAYSKINDNLSTSNNKNLNTPTETINKIQSHYTNFINSIENSENGLKTSPNKDWNSKNLLSSHMHQNIKCVKNGYSEKLVNMINKKRSDFHIWLHSMQKAESKKDMLRNTVIVEVKRVQVLNCNIEMYCELVASYQKDFSELYQKEGGADALDIIVLTNTHRSWPSQNNIENTKIKKLLQDLKEKKMNEASSSSSLTKNQVGSGKEKELPIISNTITLDNKPIQNGTLLIIKDSKTILNHPKPDILSSPSLVRKKSITIYNDLFLIFNL